MDPLTAPIDGAAVQEVAGVRIDVAPAGNGRVKRAVYPAGFRWSRDMKPHVDSDLCMHAHIGFLARGAIAGEYPDGGGFAYEAPAFVVIDGLLLSTCETSLASPQLPETGWLLASPE